MRIIDSPTPEILKRLYRRQKMSSIDIAEKLRCSPGFIRNKLREYKIPIRSIQDALSLSNNPKYPRHNFGGNLEEKAYLIGFRLGDLYVYRARSRTIIVSMNSSKYNQIKLFKSLFSKYGHIWMGKGRLVKGKEAFPLRCYLDNTFDFLIKKDDSIEPWILKNKKYFAAFLAGYSDAEGSFCLCGGNAVFSIRSQDKNIIHQIWEKLTELGVLLRPPRIVRKKGTRDIRGTLNNKNIWAIFMHRKNAILKLINIIRPYLKHADKQKRIKILANNILERDKKYNRHQRSKLDKLYLKDGLILCQATATGRL